MRILRLLPILCLLVLSACTPQAPTGSTPSTPVATQKPKFPLDDLGRAVNLKAPAQRVVCIGPGATETIFALGAGSKLVGRDQVSDYPKAALKVAVAGDYNGPFIEKVIALRPDLVIVQGETYDKARAENWQQKIGAPVAILVPTSVAKIEDGVKKLGSWLGAVKEIPIHIYPRTGHRIGVPAFFEVGRSPLFAAGEGTLISDLMRIAGLENTAQIKGYKQFNAEQLLKTQPYVYVVPVPSDTKANEFPRLLKDLKSHPVLGRLKCVRQGRVIFINSDWVLRPGPRLRLGLQELARRADAMAAEIDREESKKN